MSNNTNNADSNVIQYEINNSLEMFLKHDYASQPLNVVVSYVDMELIKAITETVLLQMRFDSVNDLLFYLTYEIKNRINHPIALKYVKIGDCQLDLNPTQYYLTNFKPNNNIKEATPDIPYELPLRMPLFTRNPNWMFREESMYADQFIKHYDSPDKIQYHPKWAIKPLISNNYSLMDTRFMVREIIQQCYKNPMLIAVPKQYINNPKDFHALPIGEKCIFIGFNGILPPPNYEVIWVKPSNWFENYYPNEVEESFEVALNYKIDGALVYFLDSWTLEKPLVEKVFNAGTDFDILFDETPFSRDDERLVIGNTKYMPQLGESIISYSTSEKESDLENIMQILNFFLDHWGLYQKAKSLAWEEIGEKLEKFSEYVADRHESRQQEDKKADQFAEVGLKRINAENSYYTDLFLKTTTKHNPFNFYFAAYWRLIKNSGNELTADQLARIIVKRTEHEIESAAEAIYEYEHDL